MNAILATLISPLLLASVAMASSDDLKAESPLTRPTGAPDADASGKVKAEFDQDKNRHKLSLEAEDIDTSLVFEAWVADGGGTLTFAGTMPFNKPNEVEIEFDSKEGPALPVGASTIQELAGRAVEVRSGGMVYLTGSVPSLDGSSGGGGGGSGGGGSGWVTAKASLVRSSTSPDADVSGYVEIRNRAKDNDQKFKVEADHLASGGSFFVFLENAQGSGVLENVGAMPFHGTDEYELEIETEHGTPLPFGVTDVNDLSGRIVQVRDNTDAVYLEGVVPSLGGSTQPQSANATFSGVVGKAELKLKSIPKAPKEKFELRLLQQAANQSVEVFIANPTGGALTMVSALTANSGGKAELKINTGKGQALPFGLPSLADLGGLALEIREAGTGNVLVSGVIPQL